MTSVTQADTTGAIGVTVLQLITERDLGWIFRRVEHRDTGIDAHVEIVQAGHATGKLFAVQVKSGLSWFKERTDKGWRFRGDLDHLHYWASFDVPVLLVLVNTRDEQAYWVHIDPADVKHTDSAWTVVVPESQRFGASSGSALRGLARATNPFASLLLECSESLELLRHLDGGGDVSVEIDEWINKSSGRCDLRLFVDEQEAPSLAFTTYAGGVDEELVQDLFPWACAELDEAYYDMYEDVEPFAVFQDSESEGGYHVVEGERPNGWRPYERGGEVESYRVSLSLNEVGRAYLALRKASQR